MFNCSVWLQDDSCHWQLVAIMIESLAINSYLACSIDHNHISIKYNHITVDRQKHSNTSGWYGLVSIKSLAMDVIAIVNGCR
jgi:hypothetical protein